MKNKYKKGFSLLEVLVSVLIILVLIAIAYPIYTKSILKARAAEAVNLLEMVRNKQIRNFARNGNYSKTFADLGRLTTKTGEEVKQGAGEDFIVLNDYTITMNPEQKCATARYSKGGNTFAFSISYENPGLGCTGGICKSLGSVIGGSANDVCSCRVVECAEGEEFDTNRCICARTACKESERPAAIQPCPTCGKQIRDVICNMNTYTWDIGEWTSCPSTDCPPGHSLNTNTCTCQCTKTEADEPGGKCPVGKWWDSALCRCVCDAVGDQCACPPDYPVWDGVECAACPILNQTYNTTKKQCECGTNGRTQLLSTTPKRCVCPTSSKIWNGNMCVDCPGGGTPTGTLGENGYTQCKCDDPRPFEVSGVCKTCTELNGANGTNNGKTQLLYTTPRKCVCPTTTQIWNGTKCVPCPDGGTPSGTLGEHGYTQCSCSDPRPFEVNGVCKTCQEINGSNGTNNGKTQLLYTTPRKCVCPTTTHIWDGTKCVICPDDGSPTGTLGEHGYTKCSCTDPRPFEVDGVCKTCLEINGSSGTNNGKTQLLYTTPRRCVCPTTTHIWNGTKCVTCPDGGSPAGTLGDHGYTQCECADPRPFEVNGVCKTCTELNGSGGTNNGKTQLLYTTPRKCVCPNSKIWDGTKCVDCPGGKEPVGSMGENGYTQCACPDNKPFEVGGVCKNCDGLNGPNGKTRSVLSASTMTCYCPIDKVWHANTGTCEPCNASLGYKAFLKPGTEYEYECRCVDDNFSVHPSLGCCFCSLTGKDTQGNCVAVGTECPPGSF